MRLVVIDAHKLSYRVYEDRKFLVEYRTTDGLPADAEQVEEARTVDLSRLQPVGEPA
jgi:hypothetical protein